MDSVDILPLYKIRAPARASSLWVSGVKPKDLSQEVMAKVQGGKTTRTQQPAEPGNSTLARRRKKGKTWTLEPLFAYPTWRHPG